MALKIILFVLAIRCALGWFVRRLTTDALMLYLIAKGYPEPTVEEWKACLKKVILHDLHMDRQD